MINGPHNDLKCLLLRLWIIMSNNFEDRKDGNWSPMFRNINSKLPFPNCLILARCSLTLPILQWVCVVWNNSQLLFIFICFFQTRRCCNMQGILKLRRISFSSYVWDVSSSGDNHIGRPVPRSQYISMKIDQSINK